MAQREDQSTATDTTTTRSPKTDADRTPPQAWIRVLAWTTAVVALTDLAFFAMIATLIPPLAAGAVFTFIGLVLLRRRVRVGVVVLALTSLVILLGNVPFAVAHLAHPSSAIDFVHAVSGSVGRVLALVAAFGAWRGLDAAAARRTGTAFVAVAAATVAVAAVAMLVTSGSTPASADVITVVDESAFEDRVVVATGETLFVDNRDLFRHTFTVEGTGLDVDLPAKQGARTSVELAPGTYDVICAIPGHEFMTATLEVR